MSKVLLERKGRELDIARRREVGGVKGKERATGKRKK